MELDKITERLKQDGLDVSSTDDDKIKHLWHLYVKTDVNYSLYSRMWYIMIKYIYFMLTFKM